ncbi:IclR family transcriptional regulator [Haloferax volcanii]|uniref:IclR family transcription regulator n=3 Tax=Haloferax volcanii TaxID=2246 RepID=D4GQC5_HALVD|nr:IclR family transcriptional regulator [Haloferax volcanii]ADE01920.1 IclR family transcription regulator [Haloferax volcanii DS2]ELY28903.1 ArcR family transcription regulator [Haloferax volcanii DS2]MBS8121074.1 IclR family transcriptional regulator [Haloferax volcanii]MBS8126085.1 IclR family transcriptional regulator [Haloferax volcanii]MBS8129939.1 IclR family transcriptional regulator [Haloferax volcanii]
MKSVLRAFEVIRTLWEVRSAGPSEVAAHLGLSKSTAHVYLRSLQETGYVVNEDGTYRLSYQFLTMGSRLKYRSRIFQVSKGEMRSLADATDELVTLFAEECAETVLLHQEQGDQALELGTYPGMKLPIYSHAAGKVFLAFLSESRTREIRENLLLEQQTEATITDPVTLQTEVDRVREDGFAFDWDQQVQGMGAIAVPVVVADTLCAVLAIACPTGRLQDEAYRTELLQKLRETVDSIAIKYQYGT